MRGDVTSEDVRDGGCALPTSVAQTTPVHWAAFDESPLKPCSMKALLEARGTIAECGTRPAKCGTGSGAAKPRSGRTIRNLQYVGEFVDHKPIGTPKIHAIGQRFWRPNMMKRLLRKAPQGKTGWDRSLPRDTNKSSFIARATAGRAAPRRPLARPASDALSQARGHRISRERENRLDALPLRSDVFRVKLAGSFQSDIYLGMAQCTSFAFESTISRKIIIAYLI